MGGMNFCSNCGAAVERRIPPGDDRPRYVCGSCETIHYQNPLLVVGTVPTFAGKVLLCRRAIEPRLGYWTLPAGFMENGETLLAGALRESWEEARARLSGEALYRLFDLPHVEQVYVFFRGHLIGGRHAPGPESSETALFSEEEIPWNELAFPVMFDVLKGFFEDRRRGAFPVTVGGLGISPADFWQRTRRAE